MNRGAAYPSASSSGPNRDGRCETWTHALICIDLQYLNCRNGYGAFDDRVNFGFTEDAIRYYLKRVEDTVIPNVRELQALFRKLRREIIHVRIQSLTLDGRDRSLEHRQLGLHAAPGSKAAEFLPEVAPRANEIVINKTASGVFIATNLEYILRNLCVSEIYFAGVYTNECISSAVRSASDLGFKVHLISDATAAMSRELHEATLITTDKRYADVIETRKIFEKWQRS